MISITCILNIKVEKDKVIYLSCYTTLIIM